MCVGVEKEINNFKSHLGHQLFIRVRNLDALGRILFGTPLKLNPFLVLNLRFHRFNRVARVDFERDGLACQSFYKNLLQRHGCYYTGINIIFIVFFENDFFADPDEFVLTHVLFDLRHGAADELDVAEGVWGGRCDPVDADVCFGLLGAPPAALSRREREFCVGVGHGEVGEGTFSLVVLVQLDNVERGDFYGYSFSLCIIFQITEETG